MNDLERQFIAASHSIKADDDSHFEITSVLNAMDFGDRFASDAELIDAIDAVMDSLFRRRLLFCPGHRWLSDAPDSIRGHLIDLHRNGNINRDAESSEWAFADVTSYFRL